MRSTPARFPSAEFTDMSDYQETVLCASSAYTQKYYLNPEFSRLPQDVQDELKTICVLFTEDVGGIFLMKFDENRQLVLTTEAGESDLNYDDIGAGVRIRKIQKERRELLEELTLYYRIVLRGEDPQDIERELEEESARYARERRRETAGAAENENSAAGNAGRKIVSKAHDSDDSAAGGPETGAKPDPETSEDADE